LRFVVDDLAGVPDRLMARLRPTGPLTALGDLRTPNVCRVTSDV
jgi:hypothetical protein